MSVFPPLFSKISRYSSLFGTQRACLRHLNLSFSQEGEDLVLHRLLKYKPGGFYIDVGAHHPYRFSNTFKFYLKGWRGINIDPLPRGMNYFQRKRPKDINLELAIGERDGLELPYYMFNEPTLNSFDASAIAEAQKANYVLQKTVPVKMYRLSTVLQNHLPPGKEIDFLSIDVEGLDDTVLRSNDWTKFRPEYVVIERYNTLLKEDLQSESAAYLQEQGYVMVAKTANSVFFHRV